MIDMRLYGMRELAPDGYPPEWHATIKHAVRASADHRCVRCRHPYRNGQHGNGEWSPCDELCTHLAPGAGAIRIRDTAGELPTALVGADGETYEAGFVRRSFEPTAVAVEAQWRILTVHHLDGDKANCRWWNLAALCQRCHLTIQGRVVMERAFMFEHSEWFKPYAAGWYAWKYLGQEITRDEALARQDELLGLERVA